MEAIKKVVLELNRADSIKINLKIKLVLQVWCLVFGVKHYNASRQPRQVTSCLI